MHNFITRVAQCVYSSYQQKLQTCPEIFEMI